MIPASIIIPIADNEGEPFPKRQHRAFGRRLFEVAGGFTRRDGVTGEWKSEDGTIYRDASFEYELALRSWRNVHAFLDIADWARVEFQQLAIFIKVAGIAEILEG